MSIVLVALFVGCEDDVPAPELEEAGVERTEVDVELAGVAFPAEPSAFSCPEATEAMASY